MAQTKRKRRTKHRGTAAGTIEARGRTGKSATPAPKKRAGGSGRSARADREPTWRSATIRACFASLLLLLFMSLGLGGDIPLGAAIGICLVATAIYVPLGYWTDVFIHRRRMNRQQKG